AQFKAGSVILKTLLAGVDVFRDVSERVGQATAHVPSLTNVDPQYLVALAVFGVTVVAYTTWGGFHAVVWTDVLQGIVMVLGVALMLPLALLEVGGLPRATRQMADMVPPRTGKATLEWIGPADRQRVAPAGAWIVAERLPKERPQAASLPSGPPAGPVARATVRNRTPSNPGPDKQARRGLGMPRHTVVEDAARTDAAQQPRVFRLLRTAVFPRGHSKVSDVPVLELKTPSDIRRVLRSDPAPRAAGVRIVRFDQAPYAYGAEPGRKGVYVTGPGPHPTQSHGFLPLSLAVSFFFMWAISGAGQPSSMVRLMAFRNTATLRRAITTVAIYYSLIYFPLVIIFCCARVLLPGLDAESDRIMPALPSI
ncbi:MAG TPA: hypothetical protein EYP14_02400, partial [Planctomycetaceae bacterium]|nr:hypothetical protein [Planctomycetaceae bacterium]